MNYHQKYYQKHAKRLRQSAWQRHMLARYGLTKQDHERPVEAQRGRCSLCGRKPRRLEVDHNHRTGKVRALLCGNCNRGLGLFLDNPALLRLAALYVEEHEVIE